jgi:hypothetical protein
MIEIPLVTVTVVYILYEKGVYMSIYSYIYMYTVGSLERSVTVTSGISIIVVYNQLIV